MATLDGSTNLIHTCAVLEILDKQQLEIPVLLTYDVFYITVHRHTTIVNSEAIVNSSMEWCRVMYDRSDNANGDRISDYTTLGHFRRELYRYGSTILVYFVVCLKIWLGPFHLKVWGEEKRNLNKNSTPPSPATVQNLGPPSQEKIKIRHPPRPPPNTM